MAEKLKWQLSLILARRLPACDVMTRLFSESLDRPVTAREKITMRLHLFTCEACRRYVAQIERMSELIKPQSEEINLSDPSVKLSKEARDRIKAALEAAAHNKN
jgi:predicted anti-sigma-YlaC factor YlaD